VLSLAQALVVRGAAGVPLPTAYPSLQKAGVSICRSQLSLIVGKPGACKSTLAMCMLAKMRVPTLAFVLDSNELTVSARFVSIATGEPYAEVKDNVIAGSADYRDILISEMGNIQVCFSAPGPEDVEREMRGFEQRYGLPPDCVLVDNLGNQTSGLENEWAALKALSLEYDRLAKEAECAIIGTHHATDMNSDGPADRTKILGKITQYARVILSVGYNESEGRLGIAVVKNTEGPSDPKAERPISFTCDPSRMHIAEDVKYPGFFRRSGGWGGGFWTPEEDD
jgi:hypothetical protein